MENDEPTRKETTDQLVPSSSVNELGFPKKRGFGAALFPPGNTPGLGPRAKSHCRKFWWCDGLVLAVIVLVIVLPM